MLPSIVPQFHAGRGNTPWYVHIKDISRPLFPSFVIHGRNDSFRYRLFESEDSCRRAEEVDMYTDSRLWVYRFGFVACLLRSQPCQQYLGHKTALLPANGRCQSYQTLVRYADWSRSESRVC